MKTILSVVGARPQFVKAAPVSRALSQRGLAEYLVHTGQHYDRGMSEVFFQELDIRPPDLNLNVGSGSHAVQTAAMMTGLESAMLERKPDWVLIYGDTNSTVAAALVAAKLRIPIAHVEAGLRSRNRAMPEEINRIVADAISSLLLVPTRSAAQNLLREGVDPSIIVDTGDVMFDAAVMFGERAEQVSQILDTLALQPKNFILATIHRAENTDDPERLEMIMSALSKVAKELPVVLPLHPRTRARLGSMINGFSPDLKLIEPVGFLDMLRLEKAAAVIATDSGGVQKEAYFHRVPCVTLRTETEWNELIEMGWNRLAPPVTTDALIRAILGARGVCGSGESPFGDGTAAHKIAAALC